MEINNQLNVDSSTSSPTANDLIILNVGGVRFTTFYLTLGHRVGTRLARLKDAILNSKSDQVALLCDRLFHSNHPNVPVEVFFDRTPYAFDAILNYYRDSSNLHIPEILCAISFLVELEYWGIDKDELSQCCALKLLKIPIEKLQHPMLANNDDTNIKGGTPTAAANNSQRHDAQRPSQVERINILHMTLSGNVRNDWSLVRQKIWITLEHPGSSTAAWIYSFFSLVFLFGTALILIMGSIPEFQYVDKETNLTEVEQWLEIGDTICVGWFTLDYFVRLVVAPDRWGYVKSPLAVIDLIAIFPFYLELLMEIIGVRSKMFGDLRRSFLLMRILRALRVLRVLRVLKVARYSRGFQSVGYTLKKSWKELLMLILFMCTTNLMFSTLMYFLESERNYNQFYSIPAAAWWCVITMTTVGYGDVYPVTIFGKILAGIVSITGIILLAFPISVIVEHFHQEYAELTQTNEEEAEEPLIVNGAMVWERPKPRKRLHHTRLL